MIQEFSKDFVFAYNKTKNIAFHMPIEERYEYLKNDKTEQFELINEYGHIKHIYLLTHIMNIGETPVFYINGEIESEIVAPTHLE